MFGVNEQLRRATSTDLQRVIEPLADYICATDRPRAALNQVLAVLTHKVEQMNTLARVHIARRGRVGFSRN
jgi:hypothetical protein